MTAITAIPDERRPLELERVDFSYGATRVLTAVSLEIAAGELAYVVGPSGSGKSTLLRLAHGQLLPAGGHVRAAGVDVVPGRRRPGRELRRRVGVVFQDYRLIQRLTALENVAYALRVADLAMAAAEARRRAAAALDEVGLGDRGGSYPAELSGGQRQRVAIARALAARPIVLLADEPTASLDEANADQVLRLLERAAGDGTAVLVASVTDVAAAGRRVYRLDGGRLEADHRLGAGRRLVAG